MAFIYPDPDKHGRGNKAEATKCQETWGFSDERLRQARQILRQSKEMAVPAGGLELMT